MAKLQTLKTRGLLAAAVLSSLAASAAIAGDDHRHGELGECSPIAVTRLPGKTIVEVAGSPDFSILFGALQATGLDVALQTPGKTFTVFAPTNEAFKKIPSAVLGAIVSDTKVLPLVLEYHVLGGTHDLRREDEPVVFTTLEGEKVFTRLTCTNGTATLHVNNSTVVVKPLAVDNGIIYVIDSVLLPQF